MPANPYKVYMQNEERWVTENGRVTLLSLDDGRTYRQAFSHHIGSGMLGCLVTDSFWRVDVTGSPAAYVAIFPQYIVINGLDHVAELTELRFNPDTANIVG